MLDTRRSFAVLAIVGALGFAGCGDDDETPSTTAEVSGASGATGASGASALLPADFIEEADAICAEGDEEIDAAAQDTFTGEPSAQDQQKFVEDVVVPNIQGQLDDLAGLDPPEEGAEALDALIEDGNAALDEIEADPEVLFSGENPFADVNQQAQALGLRDCGNDN